ncbi:hemolysin family protein [Pseudorhodoplanes sinuspersici]|uniref:Magnesium/cobalt efflux protein n=1 Tax=Pseudorhodoplanes sinuspersici TaxID=1235591 RepID=A0A1W6ZPE4_9HYPH|nr:hemolysin family protein [Pseudorhodoplanes sinuspersici]ARP99241.1 magnesium/cobalt efflux protein [Pseudorhodoplanes sinuspersici]RKE69089.1 CBS domain protein [Pseudorhodoplanes sinuspersici]
MPDTDGPSTSDASRSETGIEPSSSRNLPVPVSNGTRDHGEGLFSRWLRALFGWRPSSTRADLKEVLEESAPGELGFSPEEGTMLKNILGLRERRIEDVMVPRADIVAVQQDIQLGELVKMFENAGHSRLVAFNDTLDDPVGMVHIRDLIAFMTARAAVNPATNAKRRKPKPAGLDLGAIDLSMPLSEAKIIRPILFVPPSMPAIDLLAKMQATRIHLALVVDEYGGTDGIVSIEDIVELIVGDIEDEHDDEEAPDIQRQSDGSLVADARASIEDVIAAIGNGFDVGDALNEVDTLAGYLVSRVGRVPVRGELVPGPEGYEFEVLDADPRRVKKVKIHHGTSTRSDVAQQPQAQNATSALPVPSEPDITKTTPQP